MTSTPTYTTADLSPVWRENLFENTVVFCTGGAGTICSVQVRALVALGADACIVGRNEEKTVAAAAAMARVRPGARVLGIGRVDVRRPEELERAVGRCVAELGGLDFVIAGAAGNFVAPIEDMSPNGFRSVIEIDLIGSFNTVKATMPHLLRSAAAGRGGGAGGRILFVSATQQYSGMAGQAHVAAAKAGVDALAVGVALEYGPAGVRSNVVAPGPIGGTEGMARLVRGGPAAEAAAMATVPVRRWGRPAEVADATVFLFSMASSFVNGATLVVDGGAWRTGMANLVQAAEEERPRAKL